MRLILSIGRTEEEGNEREEREKAEKSRLPATRAGERLWKMEKSEVEWVREMEREG